MATLDHLLDIRSQLALGLEAYLHSLVNLTAWDRLGPFLGTRALTDVYVAPEVINWRRLDRDARRRHRAADLRGDPPLGRQDDVREPWARVYARMRRGAATRAIVLARPGEGKTTLTEVTCRAVARRSLGLLRARRQPVETLPLPIWLRANDLMAAGSIDAAVGARILEQITRAIEGLGPRTLHPSAKLVVDHILASWKRDSTWLFLDALDERTTTSIRALTSLFTLPCRIVLTSRVHEYRADELKIPANLSPQPAFDEYMLMPLTREQQRTFVFQKWHTPAQVADAARSWSFIEGTQPFRDMTSNGLLLTLICSTTERHDELDPATTQRVDLYHHAVRDLFERPDKSDDASADDTDPGVVVLARAASQLFAEIRRRDRESGSGRESYAWDFSWADFHEALAQAAKVERVASEDAVPAFVNALAERAQSVGLVVAQSGDRRMFLHRSFFEYLVAAHLARQDIATIRACVLRHADEPVWREIILFMLASLALSEKRPGDASDVVLAIISAGSGQPGVAIALMGEAVVEMGPVGPTLACWKELIPALIKTMRDKLKRGRGSVAVAAKTRAAAGTALGRLGDPRFHSEQLWCLPKDEYLGFVKVGRGMFAMGSDQAIDTRADGDETPLGGVLIDYDYWVARWPVTVAQFGVFVSWWDEASEQERNGVLAEGRGRWSDRRCLRGVANHPVVNVSSEDAQAYCRWLTDQMRRSVKVPERLRFVQDKKTSGTHRWQVTLPSEVEWEKAARGLDGRIYPWGDDFHQDLANCVYDFGRWAARRMAGLDDDEAVRLRSTSAVGSFRQGASPFGVEELAGNVSEWTRSAMTLQWLTGSVCTRVWRPDDGWRPEHWRKDADKNRGRVVRGGSFEGDRKFVRAAYRCSLSPDWRSDSVGFRLVINLGQPSLIAPDCSTRDLGQ